MKNLATAAIVSFSIALGGCSTTDNLYWHGSDEGNNSRDGWYEARNLCEEKYPLRPDSSPVPRNHDALALSGKDTVMFASKRTGETREVFAECMNKQGWHLSTNR